MEVLLNQFSITQNANDVFILRVGGRYICRCETYDDAILAYEDYLMTAEARQQGRKRK
jgi:hypothetical protein